VILDGLVHVEELSNFLSRSCLSDQGYCNLYPYHATLSL
jgi:hypothetical protein